MRLAKLKSNKKTTSIKALNRCSLFYFYIYDNKTKYSRKQRKTLLNKTSKKKYSSTQPPNKNFFPFYYKRKKN